MSQYLNTPNTSASDFASALFIRWLPQFAFFGVIAYFLWFTYANAINIPHEDSIYDFLQFILFAEDAEGVSGAFAEWFKHYNDHRTNASRLQVIAAYWIQGEVNFHTLALLANLSLPLILGLFYLSVSQEKYRWVILLTAALLLLHIRTYTIVLWGQAAFAYCWVFTYAFACFFALHKVTPAKFVIAALLCTLASFTFAAGQVVWLLGLAMLLHQWFVGKETTIRYAALWLLISIAMLLVWRISFEALPSMDTSQHSEEVLKRFFPNLLIDPSLQEVVVRFASFFFVILGSAFFDTSALLAGCTGVAMLGVLSYVSLRDIKHTDHRLAMCCWFVVASAAAITVGRASVVSPDYVLTTRYSFLSVLLATSLAVLVQTRVGFFKSRAVYASALLACVYCLWSYQNFAAPLEEALNKRYARFNKGHFIVFGYSGTESGKVVKEAIARGIYKPPCRPFPECEKQDAEM